MTGGESKIYCQRRVYINNAIVQSSAIQKSVGKIKRPSHIRVHIVVHRTHEMEQWENNDSGYPSSGLHLAHLSTCILRPVARLHMLEIDTPTSSSENINVPTVIILREFVKTGTLGAIDWIAQNMGTISVIRHPACLPVDGILVDPENLVVG